MPRLPSWLHRPTTRAIRLAALVALVTNIMIVFTGGIVRVTGSGLGCTDWPTCDGPNITPVAGTSGHEPWQAYVEFGNRLLSAPVLLAAVLVWWLVRRSQTRDGLLRALALMLPLGVLAQILLGGVTVLTGLSPFTVAGHFLASMILVAAAVGVYELVRRRDTPGVPAPRGLQHATTAIVAITAVVLVLGTIVTGTGPHGGDLDAPRFQLDLRVMALAHADAVWLLLGSTLASLLMARRAGSSRFRWTLRLLFVVQLAQGGIGYLQYWLGVPPALVSFHIGGATILWAVTILMWFRARLFDAPLAVLDHADRTPAGTAPR